MKIKFILFFLTFIFILSCKKNKNYSDIGKIKIPNKIEKIISISPTTSDILIYLGLGEKIIAVDMYSIKTKRIADKLKKDIAVTELLNPDMENIINMKPDVIFVSTMSKVHGTDPFILVKNMGIPVIYVKIGESIEDIKNNIMLVAKYTKTEDKAKILINNMEESISDIAAIGKTITNKKKIYFEIQAPPAIYSFGSGVFLNDIIELIGAENIFKNEKGWISVSEESILSFNPDIIMTSVEQAVNPIENIKKRTAWNNITAIKNNEIYYIDSTYISVPTHNIVYAIKDMAKKIYKKEYSGL